jgi:hypothetical protein
LTYYGLPAFPSLHAALAEHFFQKQLAENRGDSGQYVYLDVSKTGAGSVAE